MARRNQRARKIGALSVSGVLLATLVLGCTGGGSKEQDGKAANNEATSVPTNKTEGVKYPTSLKYWVAMDPDVAVSMKSYGELPLYKELEKATGTKVQFQHPSSTQTDDQFSLMLASGDLPDVIQTYWSTVAKGPDNAIKENTIIRLNELIEKHAPNLSKVLKDNPEFKKLITTDEGNIYEFPFLNSDSATRVYLGPIVRQDWLDKLKLPMPTTIDEWYTTLKAFKTQDPNGNGKADEIPLLPSNDFMSIWANAWGVSLDFYQENGKVKFGPIEPGFKSFLTTMRQWYQEGLIDKDYAATDAKLRDAKISNDTVGVLEAYVASGLGRYMDLVKPKVPSFELAGAPIPVLKKGDKSKLGTKVSAFPGVGAAITGKNKNPEATVRWLDYAYGKEGSMLFNFGIEGQSYKMVDGYPKYTDDVTKNANKLSMSQNLSRYTIANAGGPFVLDGRTTEQLASMPQQTKAKKTWGEATGENLLPTLSYTVEESAKVNAIMTDVKTYLAENITKFIMGALPIDKFEEFVSKLKSMKVDEITAINQKALERFNNRK